MPVFGYTGFMPFALEVFAFYQLFVRVHKEIEKRVLVKVLFFVLFIIFYLGCFYLIDSHTLNVG
jgi:hypothetical protein